MTHSGLWRSIDRLAQLMGKSRSGLAKSCGLDATAFNPSKRWTRFGQPRWLSGSSLSKIIEKSGMTEAEFFALGTRPDEHR